MLLRYETAAFVAGLLDPVGVRAISKVSSSIVHKTHYTSVNRRRKGSVRESLDYLRPFRLRCGATAEHRSVCEPPAGLLPFMPLPAVDIGDHQSIRVELVFQS